MSAHRLLTGLLLLALFTGPATAGTPSDPHTLRFNVAPDGYPPFTIVAPDGSYSGIVWDVLARVAERHDYQVEGLRIPRKRVDDFILEGNLDATIRAIAWTEQPENFLFTEPLLEVSEVFFKLRERDFQYTGPDALAGATIVTPLGYQYPQLERLFESGQARRLEVQEHRDLFRYLVAGERFDLAIAVTEVGLWHLRETGLQDQIDYAPQALNSRNIRLMFSRERQPFVDLFNRELARLKASGEMDAILARYR